MATMTAPQPTLATSSPIAFLFTLSMSLNRYGDALTSIVGCFQQAVHPFERRPTINHLADKFVFAHDDAAT